MGIPVTADKLFKPKPSKAVTKADITTHAALAIIRAEAEHREAETDRLRKARLEREAVPASIEASTPS
ncbi:MAG: hypothetical protein M9945_18910 [Aquamicrobium sp.]|uniref:hypothetical protein n=1 Tax=Aquamicrobium sp. TaxID=1872579 RepID=UPI00349E603D|nr:hypothetical protein [Aquamicrobium sp.]